VKVTRDKTENSQAFLTVEMEPAEVEEAMEEAYRQLAPRTSVPGFRKGKTPRAILERHLGRDRIMEQALNQLLPKAYEQAIQEQGITPIAQPKIDVTQVEPVTFQVVVPLRPEIELGDYQQIRLRPETAEVTDAKIDDVIEELRRQQAAWEPAERPLGDGDLAVIDITADAGGEQFLNSSGVQYQLLRGSRTPVPGFAEELEGLSKGEEKEFKLPVPDDFPKKEVAGKEASFKVKIAGVKEQKLPELDEAFVKQINPDFDGVEKLRKEIGDSLRRTAEEQSRVDFEQRLVEAVAEKSRVEYPPFFVEEEIDSIFAEQTNRMQMNEKALEQYLKTMNKTQDELREELRPAAVKRVTSALVLSKVAEAEKIETTDADVEAEINEMLEGVPENANADKEKLREHLDTQQSRDSIRHMLVTRKAIERLKEIAQGPEPEKKTKAKEEKDEH